jgi:hypothetical protein
VRAENICARNSHLKAVSFYNALNLRIGIQESGSRTWTVYNGTSADALPYADFNGSGTLLTRYVSGPGMVNGAAVDELLSRTSSGGTTAWYLTDKLDSVRDVVSSSGTVLDHVVYDSFGNFVTETSPQQRRSDPSGLEEQQPQPIDIDIDIQKLQKPTADELESFETYLGALQRIAVSAQGNAKMKAAVAALKDFQARERIRVVRDAQQKAKLYAGYANDTLILNEDFLRNVQQQLVYTRAIKLAHEAFHVMYDQVMTRAYGIMTAMSGALFNLNIMNQRTQYEELLETQFQLQVYKAAQAYEDARNRTLQLTFFNTMYSLLQQRKLEEQYIQQECPDYPPGYPPGYKPIGPD